MTPLLEEMRAQRRLLEDLLAERGVRRTGTSDRAAEDS
jgi:hypothetical protein